MEESFLIQTDTFELTQLDFLIRMLVATGIGFLIGLEREHAAGPGIKELFAGVRTFTIVVLLGFWMAFTSFFFSEWIVIIGFFALVGFVSVAYFRATKEGISGGTTEFSLILAYLLGAMTFQGYMEASLAMTVILVFILSIKVSLIKIVGRITQEEIIALVKFVVITLLLLPFLPNQVYGPYEVINPREIGWIIVLTSGIGFVGYILMKFLGSGKGILWTGLLGGLVSSTVVTWIFSKKSRTFPHLSAGCAVAILAASTIMIVRVGAWVYIFNKELLYGLFTPLLLLLIAGLLVAWFLFKKQNDKESVEEENILDNPLNLRDAVVFGLLYGGILLLVSYANDQFGTSGIYISTGIAALTDIDAITISVSKLGGESISESVAQNAILLATLCNTVVKISLAIWFGSIALRKYVAYGFGLIFLTGLIGFLILNF